MANRWYYQAALPRKDAAILANCPLPEVRRRWISRIVYQEAPGERGRAGGLASPRRSGRPDPQEVRERNVAPGVRFATDAYVTFARERPWPEAVAASLTSFSPDLMRDRVTAMRRHYPWIDPAGYAYFESRISAAVSDAEVGLELVLSHCRTRTSRIPRGRARLQMRCAVDPSRRYRARGRGSVPGLDVDSSKRTRRAGIRSPRTFAWACGCATIRSGAKMRSCIRRARRYSTRQRGPPWRWSMAKPAWVASPSRFPTGSGGCARRTSLPS